MGLIGVSLEWQKEYSLAGLVSLWDRLRADLILYIMIIGLVHDI